MIFLAILYGIGKRTPAVIIAVLAIFSLVIVIILIGIVIVCLINRIFRSDTSD